MPMKKFRPYTPSRRFMVLVDTSHLSKDALKDAAPELLKPQKSKAGRNAQGRVTARHRGGGNKKHARVVDFARDKEGATGVVEGLYYDPNRTANLALVRYPDGDRRLVLAPQEIRPGMKLNAGRAAPILIGNCLPLKEMPVGTFVHNVEITPGHGGQLVRSAGASAQILAREAKYVLLRLPSGEIRKVLADCKGTVGAVGNEEYSNIVFGKAGRYRWLGIRPYVRGTVMNPCDHPHGGGEGKTKGRHPRSPWGWCTKGRKTRNPKKRTGIYIVQRRKPAGN
ncbi:MAG: 50S ribosomal protein L2 [bacterium]